MAFIKRLLSWLIALIAVLAVIGLFLPERAVVERSLTIDRTPQRVFELVNGFERFDQWSPWADADAGIRYEYSGPASGKGATMSWHSDDASIGSGTQRIVESVPHERVRIALEFGDMGTTESVFLLEPTDRGTRVTWRFSAEFGYNLISRYAGLLFDNMVGRSYEIGLNNMKRLLETEPTEDHYSSPSDGNGGTGQSAPASPLSAETVMVEIQRIAFVSRETGTNKADIQPVMQSAFAEVFAHLGQRNIAPAGPPMVIAHRWDEQLNVFRFDVAVPVPDSTIADPDSGVAVDDHYAGPALRIEYIGTYDGLGAVHQRMAAIIGERELVQTGSPWEVYLNTPDQVAENDLITHVYYPVAENDPPPDTDSTDDRDGAGNESAISQEDG